MAPPVTRLFGSVKQKDAWLCGHCIYHVSSHVAVVL